MPSSVPLNEYIVAVADSTGTASATKGPYRYGDQWYIDIIATETNSAKQTTLTVYRGIQSTTSVLAGTYSGNFDTASGGTPIVVKDGDKLTFVWTNCNPSDRCQATLTGTLYSGRYGA